MKKIADLKFTNPYMALGEEFFSHVTPCPLDNPYLISFSDDCAQQINLDPQEISKDEDLVRLLNGQFLQGIMPISTVYAGHQFGVFVEQLGDGRAVSLGRVKSKDCGSLNLQLKGSGLTPYSRMGDGKAVTRSSIREYLASEAMFGLGIPTSRALGIVGSDTPVYRETAEKGAMILRLAKSWIRFGSFEYFYYKSQHDEVKKLLDYVIENHFPEIKDAEDKYLQFFSKTVESTASLIAKWQAVGFCHGVMNSDNMSILGETIDYGPFGFMEDYNPNHICNHSDHEGRYAYDQQPFIGYWNLGYLARTLTPFVKDVQLEEILSQYEFIFRKEYITNMHQKLGLVKKEQDDQRLIYKLLSVLEKAKIDYTYFFRQLSSYQEENKQIFLAKFTNSKELKDWLNEYDQRLTQDDLPTLERHKNMKKTNPYIALKNYIVQEAIQKAEEEKDFTLVNDLLKILHSPFDEHTEFQRYSEPTKEDAKEIIVSCSS